MLVLPEKPRSLCLCLASGILVWTVEPRWQLWGYSRTVPPSWWHCLGLLEGLTRELGQGSGGACGFGAPPVLGTLGLLCKQCLLACSVPALR